MQQHSKMELHTVVLLAQFIGPIRNTHQFANIWRLSVHTDVIIQKILNRLMARILKDNPQHAQKPTQESYFFSVKRERLLCGPRSLHLNSVETLNEMCLQDNLLFKLLMAVVFRVIDNIIQIINSIVLLYLCETVF